MSIPSWAKRIYRRVREQFLRIPETPRSLIVSALFLCGAYLASGILINHTGGENNSALVFVLAVVMISLLTEGYAYGIVSSIIGGFCINFFFMVPYAAFSLSYAGYPVAMISMVAISCVVCALTTRTKNQRAEAIRQEKRTKSLYELNERLNAEKAAIQLESARETIRGNILRAVSHDLRTPLTSVKGYIKGMRDGVANTPEKQERYLDIAYRKSCDMERLLQRLLYFSRLETGNLPMFPVEDDLGAFAGRFAREAGEELAASGGQVNFHPAEEPLPVRLDQEQLLRVLNNLKENAQRYAGAEPLVLDISVKREGERACLRFADNGQGVPEDQLPHLFQQFWRGDQARRSQGGEGSGLGLYIVKYVVEAHGGTVTAENDGGLAFTISLPLRTESEEKEDNGHEQDIDR